GRGLLSLTIKRYCRSGKESLYPTGGCDMTKCLRINFQVKILPRINPIKTLLNYDGILTYEATAFEPQFAFLNSSQRPYKISGILSHCPMLNTPLAKAAWSILKYSSKNRPPKSSVRKMPKSPPSGGCILYLL